MACYSRLMMAGLLADLASVHTQWVRDSDKSDPAAEDVLAADEAFRRKLDILFTQGAIMSNIQDASMIRPASKQVCALPHLGKAGRRMSGRLVVLIGGAAGHPAVARVLRGSPDRALAPHVLDRYRGPGCSGPCQASPFSVPRLPNLPNSNLDQTGLAN